MVTDLTTAAAPAIAGTTGQIARAQTQKVVIVDGSPDILALIESVFEAGHYDIVFVEASERAYSQIKRVQPNLVILCLRIEQPEGFQVLSMLKLDEETRSIPILTYTGDGDGAAPAQAAPEPADTEMFLPTPSPRMN